MEARYDLVICISTYNRKNTFEQCINSVRLHTPWQIPILVVDGCSDEYYANENFRFNKRKSISHIKNKCLEICYKSDKNNFILLDDDILILKDGWYLPYVESGEHHLCATFLPTHRMFNKLAPKIDSYGGAYEDYIPFKSHLLGNGYCLYFTRHCIETVGGFDTRFNNKYEHCDLSRRIHAAGLTKYKYQDIANSAELIYCLDQDKAIERSFTEKEIQENLKAGYDLYRQKERDNTSEFIEYRT